MAMRRVLLITGGPPYAHDFPATGRELALIAEESGLAVELTDDVVDGCRRLARDGFDVVAMNALRWRMLDDRYASWRADWELSLAREARDALAGFVRDGGGLVGNHTAAICFDDWPEWRAMLGAQWNWTRSSHPPLGPLTVRVPDARRHPLVHGLPATFDIVDEVYGNLDLEPDVTPLVVGSHPDGSEHPLVWARSYGAGRVVFDGLGHDVASLRNPPNRTILQRALRWVTEE